MNYPHDVFIDPVIHWHEWSATRLITKNVYMHYEDREKGGDADHAHCMHGPMKREFKLAMLEKKEKVLKAELEFVGKMKELVGKASEGKE